MNVIFPYIFLFIIISSLGYMLPWGFPLLLSWTINILILINIAKRYFKNLQKKEFIYVKFFVVWVLISIFRGIFLIDDYWSFKNLIGHSISLFVPALCIAFIIPEVNRKLLLPLLKYGIILFPIFIIACNNSDGPGRYLSFIYMYIILISLLPTKWKLIIILLSLIAIFFDLEARSGGIRILVAFLIAFFVLINRIITKLIKLLHPVVMVIPFVLLYLGCSGIFNIFKIKEYTNTTNEKNENLLADTRSFLYEEVITSSINNNYYIFGRTPTKGYESKYFTIDKYFAKKNNMKNLNERGGCEVSILNIFNYLGLVGVFLYFLIFYSSTYFALFKSNNIYIKLIGIFVMFRWVYAWIEDFNNFDINYVMIWFMVGMCYSTYFRKMNNIEFKKWIVSTLPFNK